MSGGDGGGSRYGSGCGRAKGVGTMAGTAGTHPPVDCTLFVGRAAGRSTERQRVLAAGVRWPAASPSSTLSGRARGGGGGVVSERGPVGGAADGEGASGRRAAEPSLGRVSPVLGRTKPPALPDLLTFDRLCGYL